MLQDIKDYFACLGNPQFASTAIRVALVVGSILFTINHGSAVFKGQMSRDRWISATITYTVPYCVNVHGQYISRSRQRDRRKVAQR